MSLPVHHCAVLDVGKTRVKLLVMNGAGEVLHQCDRPNAPVPSSLGYPALDVAGIEAWLLERLAGLGALRSRIRHLIVSTHGAAFAALQDDTLLLPVPDYESEVYECTPLAPWADEIDPFEQTCSPLLPAGLNAARQWHWLEQAHPALWQRVDTLLPYPQYWAWRLTGERCAELSSLGCHTQLWQPGAATWSALAQRRGWARRMPPLRRAWDVLAPLRSDLASRLGLPSDCAVHVGVHDSNACLAAYLRSMPRMTLVSTGTWIVIMAPGGSTASLDAGRDMLANVSVRGETVPTARFMGGRELKLLLAGADPAAADEDTLAALLRRDVMALPAFVHQGGPFGERPGEVREAGRRIDAVSTLDAAERATLGALYCAQVTAWLIEHLRAPAPVVVDGPFAGNPVYVRALAALLDGAELSVSADPLEGTARGSWLLSRWTALQAPAPRLQPVAPSAAGAALRAYHARWLTLLPDEALSVAAA
ncbi:sugar (pentulose or hexulose) kinase [Sphaerotilus hippei]|uniref:Sugar (Pentulose or hexulose) kinase n=1 Tax=Sphaerotilus hippei TaxID=744406 RepID=A0A318H639_9BURK|nr:FGGY family carbohydrate kinase [Sphaerotilus hippei]PXW99420.1 sugar (pentulose or hexulose) kinase [Sphaerotilus hippei]